jgi:CheY-like chemotaxis protein
MNKVDLILLDIDMPNISGFEFLGDIRKIPSYISVPIIIVSGITEAGFLHQARSSSANDVLSKPVNSNELISSIEKVLATTT